MAKIVPYRTLMDGSVVCMLVGVFVGVWGGGEGPRAKEKQCCCLPSATPN